MHEVSGQGAAAGLRLRAALTAGDRLRATYPRRPVLGTFLIELPTPRAVRAVALAGFDFVVIDLEHSSCGMDGLGPLITEAQLAGVAALVRVWALDDGLVGRVLDTGANGVVIPRVRDAAEASRAVEAARYGPLGSRGLAPLITYGALGISQATVGDSVVVVTQIEGVNAVEEAAAIAEVEGVDAVLVGPYDLSQALGRPGDVRGHAVAEAAVKVAAACGDHAMLGIYVDDPADSQAWVERGFRLQCIEFDGRMLLSGARSALATAIGGECDPVGDGAGRT